MSRTGSDAGIRRASAGYLASLGFGVTAIPLGAIALGAILALHHGGDPDDALDSYGLPGMAIAYGLAFSDRLVFWPKAAPAVQSFVRVALVAVMLLSLVLTMADVALLFTSPGAGGGRRAEEGRITAIWFATAACLCQVAAVTWLVRYRKDGAGTTSH